MGVGLGAALVTVVGGGLAGLASTHRATMVAVPELGLALTPLVLGKAVLIIVALGLVTGLLPAINAMRMPIINAFRSR